MKNEKVKTLTIEGDPFIFVKNEEGAKRILGCPSEILEHNRKISEELLILRTLDYLLKKGLNTKDYEFLWSMVKTYIKDTDEIKIDFSPDYEVDQLVKHYGVYKLIEDNIQDSVLKNEMLEKLNNLPTYYKHNI